MDLKLAGKIAVVTGASRGLGLACAQSLAGEGCHVAICARGAERLAAAAEELRSGAASGASVLAVPADVGTPAGVTHLIDTTVRDWAASISSSTTSAPPVVPGSRRPVTNNGRRLST